MSVKLVKNSKNWNTVTEKWNPFLVVKSNVHYKQTFTGGFVVKMRKSIHSVN